MSVPHPRYPEQHGLQAPPSAPFVVSGGFKEHHLGSLRALSRGSRLQTALGPKAVLIGTRSRTKLGRGRGDGGPPRERALHSSGG